MSRFALVVLAMVAVVIGLLYALQRQLIYFPDPAQVLPAADVVPSAQDVTLRTSDGLRLGAWFLPPQGRDRDIAVLAAPGNGGNREDRASLGAELARRGFGVLLLDYRGYGGNPGSPSEEGLAKDAEAAVEALRGLGYPPERTIYLGESLGSGVVSRLAAKHPPYAMLLRSPFTDLVDVNRHHYPFLPVRLLLRDRYPVLDHVRELDVPVLVVYGERDSVVPPELSARVAAGTRNLVGEVALRGAGHNDAIMFGPRIADELERLAP